MPTGSVCALPFEAWIRQEAALIHADGCTGITNINGWPCLQHDLEFYYGKSAVDAYRLYLDGHPEPWGSSKSVTFEEANAHFRAANLRDSALGYFNPMVWWRQFGMRLKKTREAWEKHRAREAQVA